MHRETPQVRARILAAATTVVTRDGAEQLTVATVAAEAGLSVGGLRYHFASKRDLLVGLLDASVAGFDRALTEAGDAPGAHTRAYIAATLDPGDRSGYDLTAGLLAALAVDSTLLEPLREHFGRWQRLLDDDGLDPAVALTARLAMDGWWLAAFLGLAAPDDEATAGTRAILERLVAGAVRG
ncbi:hypothetical protein AGMMS50218_18140 [Actinomycetota bacterium]|nr:hypothetical protein AGMMS50218_18140 [Actinomycetota bacterium]